MNRIINNLKFKIYYETLIEENKKYNLTSITEEKEAYIKHFYDSIQMEKAVDMNTISTLCDVGSGAGFPSIPLKIIYPHLKVTIIEPTLKRCNFLKLLVEKLQLDDVEIINDRAENMKELREKFDLVCARAVSNMQVLIELCVPLVKVNGLFVSLKGSNYHDELIASKNAIKVMKINVLKIYDYELLENFGKHSIIVFKKNDYTPSTYPRSYSLIKKKPL